MSSNTPDWLKRWQRSPRQDRRVVVDGKFVELGPVQVPVQPAPEEEKEAVSGPAISTEGTGLVVSGEGQNRGSDPAPEVEVVPVATEAEVPADGVPGTDVHEPGSVYHEEREPEPDIDLPL